MLYTIGQRVIINSLDAPTYVIALNGHTCIIKSILPSKEREGSVYILDWNEVDNPGRECNLPMHAMLWYEDELLPLVLPTAIISSLDLPDI